MDAGWGTDDEDVPPRPAWVRWVALLAAVALLVPLGATAAEWLL